MSELSRFQEQLRTAPARPGCYLFRDADGQPLYVGKARDLRKRVQVYRRAGADGRARLEELLERAADAEFRVTDTEREAILLEDRLVKLLQPPLNVLLKDDKAFLLVHLDTTHAWPRLGLARRRGPQGEFFGPYPSSGAARRAKRLLQEAFGLRDCTDHTLQNRSRPCLKHAIGLCSAPCVGAVPAADYAAALDGAREVLRGGVREHLEREQERMAQASVAQEYEVALRARDRARALRALAEPQKVRLQAEVDFDVLGIDERGQFALLEYRDGEWLHSRHGRLPLVEEPPAAVAAALGALYRGNAAEIPPLVLAPALPEGQQALEAWLGERAGLRVRIQAPARGEKRALVRMAESNARARSGETPGARWPKVAARIAELLQLAQPPAVIDCIDVSHLQGKERVASRVRFVEGRAERSRYRRYLVGGGEGNDDFAAMREVVGRVLRRGAEEGLPDLLVLDGGRGQLSAGLDALGLAGGSLPLVGLAKARRGRGPVAAEERLFLPDRDGPLILERGSPERLFFERLRDEAHRFAIGYHRRRRENLRLVLEEVPGIGPAKRSRLLDHCAGDLGRLRDAEPEELTALPGIDLALVEALQRHLRDVLP